jgi:hypothetical protein
MPPFDSYAYLWDGSEPGWVLVQLDSAVHEAERLAIVHAPTRSALLIEDDEVRRDVTQRMLLAGVKRVPVSSLSGSSNA